MLIILRLEQILATCTLYENHKRVTSAKSAGNALDEGTGRCICS